MRRVRVLRVGVAVLLATAARIAGAVDCREVRSVDVAFIVCHADPGREPIEVVYAAPDGTPFGTFDALRAAYAREGRVLRFAMNAGMFHADYRPVGLLVVGGNTLAPINRATGHGNFYMQPNGVFMLGEEGASVLATHEYRNHAPRHATQSGPLLVDRGMIPDTTAFRASSSSRHVRNGVCAVTPRQVAFVISVGKVNLHEIARVFRDELRCRDALYLDGSVSSVYFPPLNRADRHSRLGPLIAIAD